MTTDELALIAQIAIDRLWWRFGLRIARRRRRGFLRFRQGAEFETKVAAFAPASVELKPAVLEVAKLEGNKRLEIVEGDLEGVIAVKDLSLTPGKSPNARIGNRQQHGIVMMSPVRAADHVKAEIVEGITRRPSAKRAGMDIR